MGCLWRPFGCLIQCLGILMVGGIVLVLITAVFAPWGFYLGGTFHVIPYWQGSGTLQTANGKYVVYVLFYPRSHGIHGLPESSVGGSGALCTARGEIIPMKLGGGMRYGISKNTDGEKISFYMDRRTVVNLNADRRPYIELRGAWHNPNLVMDDHGSLSRAFEPDGTLATRKDPRRPYPGPIVPVTLVPGSYSDFKAACQASR